MSQTNREKIALLVFLALVVLCTAAIAGYMNLGGASWDDTATAIDDARGDLAYYTAVVYRGTAVPETADEAEETQPIALPSAVRSYEDKGASVLVVDVLHPERYEGDDIYYVGYKRIGVFFAPEDMTEHELEAELEFFSGHAVDYVVCIAEDSETVVEADQRPDIVISTGTSDDIDYGRLVDGTFYTHTPVVGKVGALLLSPDNTVSAKTLTSLPEQE